MGPNAKKGYRYIVDGEGKSSVTTVWPYKNTKAFEVKRINV
ncbi:MAG: hypothetical protein CM15mV87_200 [Caudoviricetes sp.]|nr:MAG: hypothetical protein CM15mV87_200 [Caudoviricetes sp.]